MNRELSRLARAYIARAHRAAKRRDHDALLRELASLEALLNPSKDDLDRFILSALEDHGGERRGSMRAFASALAGVERWRERLKVLRAEGVIRVSEEPGQRAVRLQATH